jgi:hypothetical protein
MQKFCLTLLTIYLIGSNLAPLRAQAPALAGKSIGLYISSKEFQFSDLLSMQVTQFLTIGEDRSYAGRIKPEFMIRLGWLLTEQLPGITGADTVHFLNADPPRGYAFREAYDPLLNRFSGPAQEALQDLDVVLVLSAFDFQTRSHRSTYVMSNRMVTERIQVKHGKMEITPILIKEGRTLDPVQVCLDDQKHKAPTLHFDFYRKQSPTGNFLSKLFSQWWEQWKNSHAGFCAEN